MKKQNGLGLKRFLRDETGSATMEFAVVLPFLVLIVFMFAEIGILTGRTALMKRGVSIAIRDVRLGLNPNADVAQFRNTVCANAFLIDECNDELTVDVQPLSQVAYTQGTKQTVVCRNREDPDSTPQTDFNQGVEGEIMLVRACLIVDPVFPGTGFGAGLAWEPGGGYWITAITAFMNESDERPS